MSRVQSDQTITDPRGNDRRLSLLTAARTRRQYTTTYTFDYETGGPSNVISSATAAHGHIARWNAQLIIIDYTYNQLDNSQRDDPEATLTSISLSYNYTNCSTPVPTCVTSNEDHRRHDRPTAHGDNASRQISNQIFYDPVGNITALSTGAE